MSDKASSDWGRSEERYLSDVFGHYAVFDRPINRPEFRSPLQRVMRQIKDLRGQRYWDHIDIPGGWHHQLPDFMHQSWFQLPAPQKEEHLLRRVDWSGVTDGTRDKIITRELRARDGEINARDEWHLHDQLMRVERITPDWDRLSSTAKLETLLASQEVDWRPFPRDFQAIALGAMIRRVVTPGKDGGFKIGGIFDQGKDYANFGRYGPGGGPRDAFEQSKRKGPKRPLVSKAEARETFRWAIAQPQWESFVREHRNVSDPTLAQSLREEFRRSMQPKWQAFWDMGKTLSREKVSLLVYEQGRKAVAEADQDKAEPGGYDMLLREASEQDASVQRDKERVR